MTKVWVVECFDAHTWRFVDIEYGVFLDEERAKALAEKLSHGGVVARYRKAFVVGGG